jgi:hypothetical protein
MRSPIRHVRHTGPTPVPWGCQGSLRHLPSKERHTMGPKAKKVILIIVLAFFVYAVFTSPDKAADIVSNIWGVLVDGFNAILTFFNSLLNR